MRISFQHFYRSNLNDILEIQSFTNKAANTVSSGKKILTPSDDPVGATQILLYNQQISNADQYIKNANYAEARLESEDALLANVSDALIRVKQLQVQAANSVNGPNELRALKNEMQESLEHIVNLANFRDSNGDYIFGGFQSRSLPFSKNTAGNYVYNGDNGQKTVQIGEGITVTSSDSGFDVFGNVRRGNGTYYVTEAAGNTGTAKLKQADVTDSSAWAVDTYTVAFSVVGNTTTYTVSNSAPAVVAGPATYADNSAINFNGASLSFEGAPANGDTFTVTPSPGQTLFGAIENSITALDSAVAIPSGSAKYQNSLFVAMQEVDQAIDNISSIRTKIGGRLNKIESIGTATDAIKYQAETAKSGLEDLDLATAITELQKRATTLEAAQASFSRIQSLSIFNFLTL